MSFLKFAENLLWFLRIILYKISETRAFITLYLLWMHILHFASLCYVSYGVFNSDSNSVFRVYIRNAKFRSRISVCLWNFNEAKSWKLSSPDINYCLCNIYASFLKSEQYLQSEWRKEFVKKFRNYCGKQHPNLQVQTRVWMKRRRTLFFL